MLTSDVTVAGVTARQNPAPQVLNSNSSTRPTLGLRIIYQDVGREEGWNLAGCDFTEH